MTTPDDDSGGDVSSRSGPSFAHAASWSFVMEGGRQFLNLGIAFLLAAVLGPKAYGLVAIALVFIMFVDLVQRQGMSAALIQRKELTTAHKDTAFWLLMAASVVLLVATLASAGWWARVNRTPELRLVIIGLSPMIPLQGLSLVQDALLRRELAFKNLAGRSLAAVTAGGVAGITTAVAGWGVWALVTQQVVQAAVAAVVLWSVSDWRPGWHVSRQAGRELLGFSGGSFLGSIFTFVNNQADALLIGIFFGPYVVGVYRLGLRLVETLVSAVSRPVQAIALPELSPQQDDPVEFRRRTQRLMRLGAVLALPALGVLAGIALPAVRLLGDDWTAAGRVIPVLCIVGVVRVLVLVDGPLLQARGKPFLQAGFTAVAAAMSAVSFVAAGIALQGFPASQQALGVAVARAVVWGVGILAMHVLILRRYAGFGLQRMVTPFAWPATVGTAGGATAATVAILLADTPALVQAASSGLTGVLVALLLGLRFFPDAQWVLHKVVRRRGLAGSRGASPASRAEERSPRVQ